MNPTKTTYCALYKDGSYVEKDTLEELDIVPTYSFLLQVDPGVVGSNRVHFKPITRDGIFTTIRIGNFGIIDFSPQYKSSNDYFVAIKIFDYTKESSYDYTARNIRRLDVFRNNIFPLMNRLNELGSWENYENQLKFKDLQKENEELAKEIKLLKVKIKQLEENTENSVQAE